MRKLFMLVVAAGVVFVALAAFQPLRSAGEHAFQAGGQLIQAGKDAVDAGTSVVGAGQQIVGQATDTVGAARELSQACDLVRTAVDPGTSPKESAALLKQAVAIVDDVVVNYPDVPGVSDLQTGLGAARAALAADPSGKSLGVTTDEVNSACSQIPSLP